MGITRLSLSVAALGIAGGCTGRGHTVRDPRIGDLTRVRGQQIREVYFVPFSLDTVLLKGNHGEPAEQEAHKAQWFTHVLIGAQLRFEKFGSGTRAVYANDGPSNYDREVMDKTEVKLRFSREPVADALVVRGAYVSSDNVSGVSRAFLGVMSGKSWTRASITFERGGKQVYSCTLDGTYLGGGFSWGYETYGANEGLGRGIAEIVEKLRRGQSIESE